MLLADSEKYEGALGKLSPWAPITHASALETSYAYSFCLSLSFEDF